MPTKGLFDVVFAIDSTAELLGPSERGESLRRLLGEAGVLVTACRENDGSTYYDALWEHFADHFATGTVYAAQRIGARLFYDLASEEEEPEPSYDRSLSDRDDQVDAYMLLFGPEAVTRDDYAIVETAAEPAAPAASAAPAADAASQDKLEALLKEREYTIERLRRAQAQAVRDQQEAARGERAELEARLEALTAAQSEAQREKDALNDANRSLKKERDSAASALIKLEQSEKELRARLSKGQEHVDAAQQNLTRELQEGRAALAQREGEAKAVAGQLAGVRVAQERLGQLLRRTEDERRVLETRLEAAERDAHSERAMREAQKSVMTQMDSAFATLREKNHALEAEATSLRSAHQNSGGLLRRLETELTLEREARERAERESSEAQHGAQAEQLKTIEGLEQHLVEVSGELETMRQSSIPLEAHETELKGFDERLRQLRAQGEEERTRLQQEFGSERQRAQERIAELEASQHRQRNDIETFQTQVADLLDENRRIGELERTLQAALEELEQLRGQHQQLIQERDAALQTASQATPSNAPAAAAEPVGAEAAAPAIAAVAPEPSSNATQAASPTPNDFLEGGTQIELRPPAVLNEATTPQVDDDFFAGLEAEPVAETPATPAGDEVIDDPLPLASPQNVASHIEAEAPATLDVQETLDEVEDLLSGTLQLDTPDIDEASRGSEG